MNHQVFYYFENIRRQERWWILQKMWTIYTTALIKFNYIEVPHDFLQILLSKMFRLLLHVLTVRAIFSLTIDVQHHLPHGRPHWLVEAEPHLSASSQCVVIVLRGGEEGAPYRGVPVTCRENACGSQRLEKVWLEPHNFRGTWRCRRLRPNSYFFPLIVSFLCWF